MAPPLIAIVASHLPAGRVARWETGAFAVPQNYVEAAARAGARTAILPTLDSGPPEEALEPFDGLMLLGGGDVDPARYGAPRHPTTYGVEPERDALELVLVRTADRKLLPTLAICRGAQVMNVAFGGTLLQHLGDVPGLVAHGSAIVGWSRHSVKVLEGSRLSEASGQATLTCSSHHHQAVDRLGEGVMATGWSEDGLVEAVEREAGWMMGVQWHPEDTAARDPAQQSLFDAFVDRARARAKAR